MELGGGGPKQAILEIGGDLVDSASFFLARGGPVTMLSFHVKPARPAAWIIETLQKTPAA